LVDLIEEKEEEVEMVYFVHVSFKQWWWCDYLIKLFDCSSNFSECFFV